MNRKIVFAVLSVIVVAGMVGFYVASAKTEGGSPWESILDVFVTGGSVDVSGEVSISGPVTIDGPVTLSPGSTVEAVMATEVVQVFYGNMVPGTAEGWYVDVDGYKTVHIYFLYSVASHPDAYSLSMDFSIPDPLGGTRMTWQSTPIPGPGVYSLEVTGPQLWLHLHGWAGADVTECKLFVYAQSE